MCCPVNGNRVYKVYVCIFRKIWQTMPLKKIGDGRCRKKNPIFYLIWLSCDAFETCILTKKKKYNSDSWRMNLAYKVSFLSLVRIMVKRDLTESFFPHRNISYLSNKVMKRNDNNKVILHYFQQNKKGPAKLSDFLHATIANYP